MDIEKTKKTVWNYFTRSGKDVAKCSLCKKILKAAGGSTSGLHSHLKSQHQVNLLKRAEAEPNASTSASLSLQGKKLSDDTDSTNKSRKTLTQYFKKIGTIDDSLSAVISRMVARDGLPLQKFCTSFDLRSLLTAKGYTVPRSSSSIKKIIMEYGDKIRNEIRINILDQLKEGARFSLTLDEWTSLKNRRYMNINVHTGRNKFWNLGLTRAQGSMCANKCFQLVESKLAEFGLNFSDIVAITTDGAAVMKKLGLSLNTQHQLCLAHGIQLAVIKVLYKKNTDSQQVHSVMGESNDDGKEEGGEEEEEEEEDGEETDDLTKGFGLDFDSEVENDVAHEGLLPIIIKIRRVVKLFRRSPLKNEVLQKHVKNEFGKEISLILDNRTRWNSLLDMVERFYQLKSCARKSLIDLNIEISFSEYEINIISTIISALEPIKLAVEALSAADCTLLCADVTHKFMIDELSTQNTTLSRELKSELILRIQERRTNFSDVVQFLHNPLELRNMRQEDDYNLFQLNESAITKAIVSLIERLNMRRDGGESEELNVSNESSEGGTAVVETTQMTMKERLHLSIKLKNEQKPIEISSAPVITNTINLTKLIKKEIAELKADNRSRGKYLTLAYNHLLTVKPTSVEAERAFSSAGAICTKIRTSLSDMTLDTICLLRAHFNSQIELELKI